jgi:leader peptidase (prepilin peptidase)/N-methyltransferase
MIIPNYITIPGIILFLIYAILLKRTWPEIGLTILFSGGLFLLTALISGYIMKRETLGGGDIKLITMIGLYVNWQNVIYIILLSSITALFTILLLYIVKKRNIHKPVPFGFYISISALLFEVYYILT